MLGTYSLNSQKAIMTIIERTNADRFTVEQKETIDAVLNYEQTTDARKIIRQKLVKAARILLENSENG